MFLEQLSMIVVCVAPMCLYACLTTGVHAPSETTDGVRGVSPPTFGAGILQSLKSNQATQGGPKENVAEVLLGLGTVSGITSFILKELP